jgi:putative SOS response-associated peptidase YedK
MSSIAPSRWKLTAPWTAENAAHRALENARAFSTSFHRPSSRSGFRKQGRPPG